MRGGVKAVAVAAAVVAAALVPLFGDPRSGPVTHSEWARMLLNALDLNEVVEVGGHASLAFSILSWKNSLSYRADNYLRAVGVEVTEKPRRVVGQQDGGEVVYPFAIVRAGDYRLRLRLAGDPDHPAIAEIASTGETAAATTFSVVPASAVGWLDAGTTHLNPGAYTTAVTLPSGAALEQVELAPPCLNPVEPITGWKASATTTNKDIAVTAVQAIDREAELPSTGEPIETLGSDFQISGGEALPQSSSSGLWLRAGPRGLQAAVFVYVPEPGLYAVSAFGIEGGGQSWSTDACRKAVLCPSPQRRSEPTWRPILTAEFTSGRHFFTVTLGPGSAVERLRLELKKRSEDDYLETIRRLGYDPGPDDPVTRAKAVEAMEWIRQRRSERPEEFCAEPVVNETTIASGGGTGVLAPPTIVVPPVVPPGGPGSGSGPPPISPPVVPPQPPGSPTTI